MRNRTLIGFILWLGLAGGGLASESLPYTYTEFSYLGSDIEGRNDAAFGVRDVESKGFGLQGSLGLGEHFHVFLDFSRHDFNSDMEVEFTALGVGTSWPVSPRVDAVIRGAYVNGQAERDGAVTFTSDGDGYLADAAVRGLLSKHFELEGGVRYQDVEGIYDDTTFRLIGRIRFNNTFSMSLGGDVSNEGLAWLAGLRISFTP